MLVEPVGNLASRTATTNARVQLSYCAELQLHAYLHLVNIGPQYTLVNSKFQVGMRPTLYALMSHTMYSLWKLKNIYIRFELY